MKKTVVKYSITFLFLLVYINRGIFIAPYEAENHGNKEVNSLIELLTQLITGNSNDIDEDGDLQNDWNSVKTVSFNFYQEVANYLDLLSSYSTNLGKIAFPNEINFLQKDFITQIDHPPQKII